MLGGAFIVVVVPLGLLLGAGSFLSFAIRRRGLGGMEGLWARLRGQGGGLAATRASGMAREPPLVVAWAASLALRAVGASARALAGHLAKSAALERLLHAELSARARASGVAALNGALLAPPIISSLAVGSGGGQRVEARCTVVHPAQGVTGVLEVEARVARRGGELGGARAPGWWGRWWSSPSQDEAAAAAAAEERQAARDASRGRRHGAGGGGHILQELREVLEDNEAECAAEAAAAGGLHPLHVSLDRVYLRSPLGDAQDLTLEMERGRPSPSQQEANSRWAKAAHKATAGRVVEVEVREKRA